MNEQVDKYLHYLVHIIVKKIDADINELSAENIVKKELSRYIYKFRPNGFHNYYFQILNNEERFLENNGFFREFKSQYSLQGIDNKCLENLESKKIEMLSLIKQDRLFELYSHHFASVQIRHKDHFVNKNLGSFFAKFVHTFRPADYCALDNPIKNYFGLKNESFFIAFLAFSKAYKIWSERESSTISIIRREFKGVDKQICFRHDKMSDLKILDLIFWTKANSKEKKDKTLA